ncbi:MAG: putative ABC transporter permease protein [Anaerolineales bacterium]|nr:putative ABC transporter permease protein [Anaerolineales bacterium]MBM2847575.1 putative transporter permease protein [Anaerolineales bacterium]
MTTTASGWNYRLPFTIRIEPRLNVPRWLAPLVSVGAIVVALLLGAVVLKLVGGDPLAAYAHIGRAAFGDIGVFSDTLVKATPLIMVGLACSVAFRMRLWNIGAEGQFYMGALGASAVILSGLVPETASRPVTIAVMLVAGMLCGAAWGFIPGWLKARLRVNEIITTLMMNYIAVALVNFFVFGVWSEGGFQMSKTFQKAAWLPRLADYAKEFTAFRGLTTHFGLVFGVVAAVVVWYILYRSLWGYEIRLIGDNARAAEYAGINITRNTVLVMMLSGALAGLAGMSEIAGVVHRLQTSISPGYGFTGIIIAWLAKLNPLVVIPVSILFGGLILAGREIQPSGVPRLIQGIILFMLIASEVLLRYRIRIVRTAAVGTEA